MKPKWRNILGLVFMVVVVIVFFNVLKPASPKTFKTTDDLILEMYEPLNESDIRSKLSDSVTSLKFSQSKIDYETFMAIEPVNSLKADQNGYLYYLKDDVPTETKVIFKDTIEPTINITGADGDTLELQASKKISDVISVGSYDLRNNQEFKLETTFSKDIDRTYDQDFELLISAHDGVNEVSKTLKIKIVPEKAIEGTVDNPLILTYEAFNKADVLINKTNVALSNYVPKLEEIPSKYAVSEGYRAHPEAVQAYINMVDAMKDETGLWMYVTSSYRDFELQTRLYNNSIASIGFEAAQKLSARPGASEHQTGYAIDVVTEGVSMYDFGTTKQSQWVNVNAHRFGFIIRYQEAFVNETGYNAEPWHLRYLGTELATKVYQSSLSYEAYLGKN